MFGGKINGLERGSESRPTNPRTNKSNQSPELRHDRGLGVYTESVRSEHKLIVRRGCDAAQLRMRKARIVVWLEKMTWRHGRSLIIGDSFTPADPFQAILQVRVEIFQAMLWSSSTVGVECTRDERL